MTPITIPVGAKNVLIDFDTSTPPPVNQLPVVNAGANQTIKLPSNSVNLSATASDPDGTISLIIWEKVAGSGTLTSNNSLVATVTGLVAGTSIFRCTVIDDQGATRSDDVSIIVVAADAPPPVPGDYGMLIYSNGFDKQADLDPFGHGQAGNGSISTSVFKTGPGSFKSVPASVSSGIRSEVQFNDAQTPSEGAVEYDVMYVKILSGSCHSLQFHPHTSGGSASPGLWHESGKFSLVNWKGGTNTKYPTGFTIPANKWMHIVLQFKFGSQGYLKFTIDGVVVLDKSNIQVGDGSGQYFKLGLNSWSGSSSEIYYDNLKIYKK